MNRRKSLGRKVATGGISTALSIILMLFSSIIPFSIYALPAMAGIALLPIAIEISAKSGYTAYIASSILMILIVPNKEATMMFVAFLGYYPMLKLQIDIIKSKFMKILIKVSLFNISIISGYLIIIYLFRMQYLLEEFSNILFVLILLVFANISFLVYDYALNSIYIFYYVKLRKKLFNF